MNLSSHRTVIDRDDYILTLEERHGKTHFSFLLKPPAVNGFGDVIDTPTKRSHADIPSLYQLLTDLEALSRMHYTIWGASHNVL
jgi:hypothetical protein